MKTYVDTSVYPDTIPPEEFFTLSQKADYLHRVLSAFDFGLPPEAATLRLLAGWREVFDTFVLPGSPGYHALRSYFGWVPVETTPFSGEPAYLKQDAFEGRTDGFENRV